MRIGLFGGTFDPPHIAHIALAENILQNGDIDEIWFLVTPQNPWKTSNQLTLDAHRLEMVKLCTEGLNGLIVSDYEYHLSKPTYSYQTLRSLRSNYPNHSFCLLVGVLVMASLMMGAIMLILGNLIADLLLIITDPRIRRSNV